jgi:hypothetical protein
MSGSRLMARRELTIVCGPMFAGKSTALLEQAVLARAKGLCVYLLKPVFDTRRDACCVTTLPWPLTTIGAGCWVVQRVALRSR